MRRSTRFAQSTEVTHSTFCVGEGNYQIFYDCEDEEEFKDVEEVCEVCQGSLDTLPMAICSDCNLHPTHLACLRDHRLNVHGIIPEKPLVGSTLKAQSQLDEGHPGRSLSTTDAQLWFAQRPSVGTPTSAYPYAKGVICHNGVEHEILEVQREVCSDHLQTGDEGISPYHLNKSERREITESLSSAVKRHKNGSLGSIDGCKF